MPNKSSKIFQVISVCSSKDIDVWTVAAKHVIQFIDADSYLVIVPDKEVELFSAVTCEPYQVKPESDYVGNAKERISQKLDAANQHRVGWYLQQFVKISAVLARNDGDVVLIWDADTVPLKPLEFIDANGQLVYYRGEEFRKSYFDFLERALGLKRTQTFSFIAQSLVLRVAWARELFESLEKNAQLPWMDAILSYVDPSEPAGFAEFETLGTWIWHHHRNEIVISDRPWYRNGFSLVGNPLTLSQSVWRGLAKYYDFVSFEIWDQRYGIRQWLKKQFRKFKLSLAEPRK
jgi:hypothetical protein